MTKREKIISFSALALLAAAAVALFIILLTRDAKPVTKSKTFYGYFGTADTCTLICYSDDSDEIFEKRCKEVENLVVRYHKLSDIYHKYKDINNLKTLNDSAGGDAVVIDPELFDMLEYAKKMYYLTNGDVNIAMGAVLSIWHEYRNSGFGTELPPMDALTAAAEHCDIESLVLDRENMTARLTDPKSSVDVGAIAKGYATERAAELLESMGADGYALSFSGNIRTVGKHPDDGLWDIKIRNPLPDATGYATELKLEECAVVTSGGYENFYEVDGVRYHHIINKDTLMPADFFASVSVIHKDSGFADCMSTALFNMSYEDGLSLIKRAADEGYGELTVIWITLDGEIIKSN